MSDRLLLTGIASTAGIVGACIGYLARRPPPLGSLWIVGRDLYVDEPFFTRIRERLPVSQETDRAGDRWQVIEYRKVKLRFRWARLTAPLPGQRGRLAAVRNLFDDSNDEQTEELILNLARLGYLEDRGVFRDLRDLLEGRPLGDPR
jgi:hypothetical protein